MRNSVDLPAPFRTDDPDDSLLVRKVGSSISRRSPYDLRRLVTSSHFIPQTCSGGINSSLVSLRFWYSVLFSSSKRARQALPLD